MAVVRASLQDSLYLAAVMVATMHSMYAKMDCRTWRDIVNLCLDHFAAMAADLEREERICYSN